MKLTSKNRAKLKTLASREPAILQVGKNGIGEQLIKQVDDALEARELIKLTILENAAETPQEAAEALCEATNSDIVQIIGRKLVLFRRNHANPKINFKE